MDTNSNDSIQIDKKVFDFIYESTILTIDKNSANFTQILTYYINKICTDIIILTNRTQFPEDLKYLVVELTRDAYAMYKSSNDSNTSQNIQSMSEDGRSVTFGSSAEWKVKYNALIATQLAQNEKIINRYRLLYKVRCPYAKN